jgi:hypothetical protein
MRPVLAGATGTALERQWRSCNLPEELNRLRRMPTDQISAMGTCLATRAT